MLRRLRHIAHGPRRSQLVQAARRQLQLCRIVESIPLPLSSMSVLQLVRTFNGYVDVVGPNAPFAAYRATFLKSVALGMVYQVGEPMV